MIYNINAGHNIAGGVAQGAVGIKNESTENRKVKEEVIKLLKAEGKIVYDCTVDNASSVNENLKQICNKCNSTNADVNIFIHFNSFDGKAKGTEAWIYSENSKCKVLGERITTNISKLGFVDRGVKINPKYYVLRHTKKPSIIIECAFIDSKGDMNNYNYKEMARAIVEGLLNKEIETDSELLYRVCTNTYKNKKSAYEEVEELKKKGYPSAFVTIV